MNNATPNGIALDALPGTWDAIKQRLEEWTAAWAGGVAPTLSDFVTVDIPAGRYALDLRLWSLPPQRGARSH